MDAKKDEVTSFKCRKCRQVVFGATHLSVVRCTANNASDLCDNSTDLPLTAATTSTATADVGHCQRTLWYLGEESAPSWVNDAIEKSLFTKGRLNCPKCNGRLGAFDFIARRRCPCGQHLTPVIHIARNRVDPVSTRMTSTEKRPKLTCTAQCNCNKDIDTRDSRHLVQSGGSDLMEVHRRGTTEHLQYGKACILHSSHNPHNAISVVTDHGNRSLLLSAVSGHTSRSLPAYPAKDHNIESRVQPDEEGTARVTETGGSVDCLFSDDNQFSVLASQVSDPEFLETVSQDSQAEVPGPSQEVVDQLTCAVCLCFFHEPHVCEPCGHVFCSSCLRRLCAASVVDTRCPLCRSIIERCIVHHEFDEDIKRLFPDEVSSRTKLERKTRIGQSPLPGGQRGIVQFLRDRRYAPGQRSSHYFMTSVCLVLLLIMITFTILATTVGVVVIYLVELFVDVGVELLDDISWFVNYATQIFIVFCVEGTIPQELSKLWLGRVHRIVNDIARIANRTLYVGENIASGDEFDMGDQRGVHTSYYTQCMLSKMAQANAANVILLSCLGIFLVYKLLLHRRLIR